MNIYNNNNNNNNNNPDRPDSPNNPDSPIDTYSIHEFSNVHISRGDFPTQHKLKCFFR